MESRKAALSLLFLAVIASGCIEVNGTHQESSQAIAVHSLSVTPGEIHEDATVTAELEVANVGLLPADVRLGDDERGREVLKNYCRDLFEFDRTDFDVMTSGDYDEDTQTVTLQPRQELRLSWRLNQDGDIPTIGDRCDFEFEMEFDYSVSAYRQVQIKRSQQVQGSPELHSMSSSGPLLFRIDTRGGTAERPATFIADRDSYMDIILQLENQGEQGYAKGIVDIDEESLSVRATEPLKLDEGFDRIEEDEDGEGFKLPQFSGGDAMTVSYTGDSELRLVSNREWDNFQDYGDEGPWCDIGNDEELRMFEGQSRPITCSLPVPSSDDLEDPADMSEVFARVNYTYVKDIGSRRVEVEPRG